MLPIRLGIQQRVLPHFRAPLYAAIARRINGCVEVFTGSVELDEGVVEADGLEFGSWQLTTNLRFGWQDQRFYWQEGFTKWIEIYQPDVLAVECNPRILSNLVGFKKARELSIPLIGWGMGVMGNADDQGLYGRVMKRYFSQFDAMIAYGTKGAADYAKLGVRSENIFIAPNSVSNSEAEILYGESDQGSRSIELYREKLNLREVPVVLFLGRLIAEKQVDLLLEAVNLVREPCEIFIVGDGPIRQELESIATKNSMAVRFFGHLEGRELALVIAMSDIAVLPGLGGLAVQEVMSYGKPVIVGSADGTQWDLVKDGETGYHLREQTPLELARLLSTCFANPNRLSEMGKASRNMIQTKHNMELSVDAVVTTLDCVMSRVN